MPPAAPRRYRFGAFVLSQRRRALLRDGQPQPLIPRYFDLLVYLVERRHDAVHRRDIFDHVWTDVIVSDSALSQAIRTIRRTLGDDSREPRFVRTVSRHGYQFVAVDVREEDDDGDVGASALPASPIAPDPDPFAPLLARLTAPALTSADEEEQRDAAERIHALGTAEALLRLGDGPGHDLARALLRDTRWDAPAAGAVPIAGTPHAAGVAWQLVRLRLTRAASVAAARAAAAAAGGGLAGAMAGGVGGLLLAAAPGSIAPWSVAPVLLMIGGGCGVIGGAGVGAGLAAAEATVRSYRLPALVAGGALGGGLVGAATQAAVLVSLAVLVGVHVPVGGGVEGVCLGAAAALGYGLTTADPNGGLAAPRGARRLRTLATMAVLCGLVALGLSLLGRPLVGGTVHAVAAASAGAQAVLTPLGRLIGEPSFGPLSAALISVGEGAIFGAGLAWGVTRRGGIAA